MAKKNKYRRKVKKPPEIEAEQFSDGKDLPDGVWRGTHGAAWLSNSDNKTRLNEGDWVVTNPGGGKMVMKNEEFILKYEEDDE